MVCVNCLSQRQPFLEQSFSYYNFAFSEENHLLFCNEKHDFFPNLWLKINELLKDTFLLSSNKIIHFLVPHDWQICINSRPLVLQYKPLLLVFKEWLFIFRTCTRRLPSVNWHTDMGSVQSKCISNKCKNCSILWWTYLTKVWWWETIFCCLTSLVSNEVCC